MKNYRLHVSEGFRDIYGNLVLVSKEIEYRIMNIYKSFGYELIKTPTIEYDDVYSIDGRKSDLYNLINRQGEVLALCNDMTSSIARFVGSNKSIDNSEHKYCYVADTFRYPRIYQGKMHQFLQAGVELISNDEFTSDVECLYLAYMSLKKCNVHDFTVHLGSNEFINLLLADLNLNSEAGNIIHEAIASKDYVSLRNVLNENLEASKASFIIDIILRGGKLSYIEKLITSLDNTKACESLKYLKRIYQSLEELGCDNIVFDFSIYSYADYYTGIVFQCYIDGINHEVISGGRSNTLLSYYSKNGKDVGFGIDLDALALYALDNSLIDVKATKYLSIADEKSLALALRKNNDYRETGIIVNFVKLNKEEAINYALKNGYSKILVFTNNELIVEEVAQC